jgi:hypothetical protein
MNKKLLVVVGAFWKHIAKQLWRWVILYIYFALVHEVNSFEDDANFADWHGGFEDVL